MIRFKQDGGTWETRGDFQPLLAAVLASAGTTIKQSAAKLVTRHDAGGRTFYIKRYRHAAFALRPAKFFFKSSQARDEWQLAGELERRRVPAVRHVALGERWSWRGLLESVLITEAFAGVPLDAARAPDYGAVVSFVEYMAAAGVMHTDLHPANLLVSESTGEIRLVDLHGMRIYSAPVWADEMLAFLRVFLPLPVSDALVLRSGEIRKQAFAHRARRCLKRNRDFDRRRLGSLRWQVRLDFLTPEVLRALENPDQFLAGAKSLKAGRSSTVAAANGIVMKRFNFRRWLRPLKDLARESRARAAFRKAYHLELAGIPTARAIAAADDRVLGMVWRGFMLMEEIPGAFDLAKWTGSRRGVCGSVAELVARLHEEGFSHRDLKESNILLTANGSAHLIDLEGLKFERRVKPETAAANLRRLAQSAAAIGQLTRPNVIVFLLHYCRARGIRPRDLFARS